MRALARTLEPSAESLVGRADELGSLELRLEEIDRRQSGAVALLGEAGIGKTRLLKELIARAELRGHLVLTGSASELERDQPFSCFVDALDDYVRGLDANVLEGLGEAVQAELSHVLPSLAGLNSGREVSLQHERYRTHRAVRSLLELLARTRPLILALDDVHWADASSVELIGTLLRHRPRSVLIALALRPRQVPERFALALERAHRAGALTRIELGVLGPDDSRRLLGQSIDEAEAAVLIEESGGNPFFLEQLARSYQPARRAASRSDGALARIGIPSAVADSLSEELSLLSPRARLVLEGASVAGDPFEPDLAAEAARTSEAIALDAIDELLQVDLIRETEVPRRLRFRHPIIRRAVYDSTRGGWRLGAHERCAAALAARRATPAARAHHIERSARQGDLLAIEVLRKAGEEATRLAPASAARWFGSAVRLLPDDAPPQERVELLLARAKALTASGYFADSHVALLAALEGVPEASIALRCSVAVACAGLERLLGRYEQAHARLVDALRGLPEAASVETVGLLIELTVNEFYRSRYDEMHGWAWRAVSAARDLGDAGVAAAALATAALAHATTGPIETALAHRAEAAALVDSLPDEELSLHLDAPGWLAAAELYLDLNAEADVHASRVLALARATGRGDSFFRLYQILPRVWYMRGRLAEAAELLDGAIETVRLLGTPPALAGNLFNRSVVAIATGDLDIALATAEEAFELTRGLDEGFVSAWAAARLASVLLETAQPLSAVDLLVTRAGGDELALIPGGWRASCLELLTRCWLALGRSEEAARAAGRAEAHALAVQTPLAGAWAGRALAAVALDAGDAVRASELALASAAAADSVGAPIEAARSRVLAGRALAQAGLRVRAVAELQRAADALDACGALRYRQSAERELGKLGHRPHRRTRRGSIHGAGIGALTERELEVARLVVDRRTNTEIALELFLSPKTVETHLANIFNKLGISDRVALARAVEHSDRVATAARE